ncbi:tripartite tricarboxylate transporter permease [Saliphagus sp. GCM10025334]
MTIAISSVAIDVITFAPAANFYIDNALEALQSMMTLEGVIFLVLGTVLGLIFGVLPGLGGAVALALLIPLTFGVDSHLAFIMMSSAIGGSAFGGSVSAILLNIPGTAPNAATLLDGYPLARQGQANYALGASATASAGGAIIGLIFLVLSLPFIRSLLRLFGPTEFFALAVFGLLIIAFATRGSLLNGLIGGCIGLLLAFVGFNPVTGGRRFTFDFLYLYDGVQLLTVIIGVFAISEMLNLYAKGETISGKSIKTGGSVIDGVKSVFYNYGIFIRSSIVGVIIGMVPGAGGTVANFVAYVQAAQLSDNPEKFGTGDIRGVIASEASNDAKDGGSVIPTIGFGIPGSASWAVMLGAFLLHGIMPGPQLMSEHLDIVFIIIFSLLFSNILTSLIGIALAEQLAKITLTPIEVLAPVIFIISLVAAYTLRFNIYDMVAATIFGIFGFVMIIYGISRIALIIGLVLGPIAEESFHQALQIGRGSYSIFYTRPIAMAIFGLAILMLVYPVIRERFRPA